MEPEQVYARIKEARQLRDSGDRASARAVLDALWTAVTDTASGTADDYLAIAVAHDYGHLETDGHERLRWHLDALERIERFEPQGDVRQFRPSAYVNVGQAYLALGEVDEAGRYLQLAEDAAPVLDDDAYGRQIKAGIAAVKEELAAHLRA